jgi:hypothetical protein
VLNSKPLGETKCFASGLRLIGRGRTQTGAIPLIEKNRELIQENNREKRVALFTGSENSRSQLF